MRVPEAPPAHPVGMRAELRPGRQARAGVVEVDVAARVEVGILGRTEPVEQRRALVAGVGRQEAGGLYPPVSLDAAWWAGPFWQGCGHDFPRTVRPAPSDGRPGLTGC